jgi:hypothetical protein
MLNNPKITSFFCQPKKTFADGKKTGLRRCCIHIILIPLILFIRFLDGADGWDFFALFFLPLLPLPIWPSRKDSIKFARKTSKLFKSFNP